jgi:hypothetical protein
MKDAVLFMRKDYNFWTVLSVLQEYMKVSGINSGSSNRKWKKARICDKT